MNWWWVLYVVIAAHAWLLNAWMVFAYFQSKYPTVAEESKREDLGHALALGAWAAAIWPLGVPMVFCMSGFARFGVRFK